MHLRRSRVGALLAITLLFLALSTLRGLEDEVYHPIDFAKVPRSIAQLPPSLQKPLYGLFLFGSNGETHIWVVLDQSQAGSGRYDVLYFDRNGDGDLTGRDERIPAAAASEQRAHFEIGDFVEPQSKVKHTKFTLTWTPASVRFSLEWRGQKRTFGCFGPKGDSYCQLGPSPAEAPIFVPGYDRPLSFEHWMSGTLRAGAANDFKVFVGNRGDRTGAFTSVDDKFLPKGEYVLATLVYRDGKGKEQRVTSKLIKRC